ncbi:ABC transporter family substrate-binding protein [Microbacterium sp. STN6]|uniref:ABC transporter family substrate-binding protein n=1 Tax=Microbacterium sp. STN6 TaxID=2995588 RepID=UPI002260C566|nr:ABC transporter family substrate-binding protein [Microbacterium sp. STN6]MCX7521906.1 ABC transporter family substrate-binding protein [Microbacterium sp. STN6]
MKIRRIAVAAAMMGAGALILTGCSAPKSSELEKSTSLSVAWNQPFYSYNNNSSTGNNVTNANIRYLTSSWFNYYDNKSNLVNDTWFGTVKKTSDDPLTVKYTINKGVTWSDGTPVDSADLMLAWVAQSGVYNDKNVEPKLDDNGNVTNQKELDNAVYFNSAAQGTGLANAPTVPKIGDDGRSLTVTYKTPDVGWEINMAADLPAHAVMEVADPSITDAQKAKDALVKAVQTDDAAVLKKVSATWNTAFDMSGNLPSNKMLFLSDGPYVVTGLKKDQYITLKANDKYDGDHKAQVKNLTVRFIPDALSEVQALQNGEVSIIQPQSTQDVQKALDKIKNVKTSNIGASTYEHVDLTFNNGGPFDPATYGGDAAKAQLVREAFLLTVPRDKILDQLIKPLNPNAVVDNSQTQLPGTSTYDDMIKANDSSMYAKTDIDKAKSLLAQAGVTTPVNVKFMYDNTNPRRVNEFALIQASAKDAGFNVVDSGNKNWSSLLGNKSYDAIVFAWQNTGTNVTQAQATFQGDAGNNFNGYNNAQVNDLWNQIAKTLDESKQQELLRKMEKIVYDDAYGLTLYQFPQITAWSNDVSGVSDAPLSPTYFWNFWEWQTK